MAKPVPTPLLKTDAPDPAKVAELDTREEQVVAAFDAGDMSAAEFRKAMKAIDTERRDLDWAQREAELAKKLTEGEQLRQWQADCAAFMAAPGHERYNTSPLLYQVLNNAVVEIANSEEAKNLSGPEILEKAHERVQAELGLKDAKDAAGEGKGEGKDGGKKPAEQRQVQTRELPPTIGKLPASDPTDTGESRFKALERLAESDPLAYEAALAKLSDADRNAFLMGA